MTIFGSAVAGLGIYIHLKRQNSEAFKTSVLNRVTIVGASYLMSFGGILLILGVTFLYQILTK